MAQLLLTFTILHTNPYLVCSVTQQEVSETNTTTTTTTTIHSNNSSRDLTLRTHIGIRWVFGERWCRFRTTTLRITENVTRIMVSMM